MIGVIVVVMVVLGIELYVVESGGVFMLVVVGLSIVLLWLFINVMFVLYYVYGFYGDYGS